VSLSLPLFAHLFTRDPPETPKNVEEAKPPD
jgi:hypothetical protein